MAWYDFCFLLFYFIYGFKNQNRKFLCLEKTFISCYLALFMASKTKTASFHDLIKTLFLVLLLRFWVQNQNGKFLCFDKTFLPCSFAWYMAIRNENFLRLNKNFVTLDESSKPRKMKDWDIWRNHSYLRIFTGQCLNFWKLLFRSLGIDNIQCNSKANSNKKKI